MIPKFETGNFIYIYKILYVPNIKKHLLLIKEIRKSTKARFKLVKLRVYVNLAIETNIDVTFFDVITNERWRKAMKE
jgi:hypothetical protein